MLATMTTFELIDEANELGQAILSSDIYQGYVEAKKQLEADEHAQQLIRRFTDMKDQYEDVQRFGKFHPDYHKVSTEIRQAKREMDVTPSVSTFKKAERELEMLLNEVSEIVARSVSDTIKVPSGNPFFDSMSCSGGCGSGGSCGCK